MESKRPGYAVLISAIIIMLLVVLLMFLFNKPSKPVTQPDYCRIDSDCVPAQCCHPTNAVNEKYAPDCSNTACTAVCLGPLDCGAGEIKCVENKCKIVPADPTK